MRYLLFALLLTPCAVKAQKFPILRETVQSGSVTRVNEYIYTNTEVNAHEYPENNIYWRLYREIMPGYYEGTLQVYHSEPYINNRKRTYSIRIQMLIKDSTIFYHSTRMMDEKGRYSILEDSSKREEMYDGFINAFKQTYAAPLQTKYLFIDSINYGNRCREDGEETAEYKQMKEYVSKQNQKALAAWLRSGNTELQLYAVKGFMQLDKRGVSISNDISSLMEIVLTKKGNVNLCLDGVERRMQMRLLAESFKTD